MPGLGSCVHEQAAVAGAAGSSCHIHSDTFGAGTATLQATAAAFRCRQPADVGGLMQAACTSMMSLESRKTQSNAKC